MKISAKKILISLLTIPVWGIISTKPVTSQSLIPASDGTGTNINSPANNPSQFNINGGTQAGANLFHSFEQFNLNAGEIANFLSNPNIANILSRIVGGNPSVINGLIQVTGGNSNLFLMNPAGILFGNDASLNVIGDFTATTATGIGFTQGVFPATGAVNYPNLTGNPETLIFDVAQPGAIINEGDLSVAAGRNLSLVGGSTVNLGSLRGNSANITVQAVPGSSLVRISQPGALLSFEVELPENTNGMTAKDLWALVKGDGVATPDNLALPTESGVNLLSGNIDVSGDVGGKVQVLGEKVGLINLSIEATGINDGGNVLVGENAAQTVINGNSSINVDALNYGDGGKVVISANSYTNFSGNITARGGSSGGDGGFVEVSGKDLLVFTGTVDAGASQGDPGSLLIDPKNIIISDPETEIVTILNPNNPNVTNGEFGFSVATVGSDVLIGAPGNNDSSGQAFLFNNLGTNLLTLDNPNPQIQGRFGEAVAGVGSDLLIAAIGKDWSR